MERLQNEKDLLKDAFENNNSKALKQLEIWLIEYKNKYGGSHTEAIINSFCIHLLSFKSAQETDKIEEQFMEVIAPKVKQVKRFKM